MNQSDLDDIQGLIIRGYRMPVASHLVLRIDRRQAFAAALRRLTEENEKSPFITVATDWVTKPPKRKRARNCVNIGFTFAGLKELGVPDTSLVTFPDAFKKGAPARAKMAGETGSNAPEHWHEALKSDHAHAILSVYADGEDERQRVITAIGVTDGPATVLDRIDAYRLRHGDRAVEHFGYVDGLSQPTIEGVDPIPGIRDPLPPVKPGEFVLGHEAERDPPWHAPPRPPDLGYNGSFAAFRVMFQDVPAFWKFLASESARLGIDRELLAAKVCGRWRNGEPLVMRPPNVPAKTVPDDSRNDFDYEITEAFPFGDREGSLCPRGAHIRRAFPRSQRVVDDGVGNMRRIVRRGMPYGPPCDPADPKPGERGLVGLFICASLENQYEYIMGRWLNGGAFTGGGLADTKDPLIGANDPAASRFVMPGARRMEVKGFPRFVITRGCAYLFLPSMTALRYLAKQATDPYQAAV